MATALRSSYKTTHGIHVLLTNRGLKQGKNKDKHPLYQKEENLMFEKYYSENWNWSLPLPASDSHVLYFYFSAQTCVRLIQVLNASDHQSVASWADGVTQYRKIELVNFKTYHYRTYSSQSKEPPGSNTSNAGGGSKKTTPPGTSKGTSVGGNKGGRGGDRKGGSGEWWCPKCGEPCTHVDAYVCKSNNICWCFEFLICYLFFRNVHNYIGWVIPCI